MIAAADGNPLLALESARAAGARRPRAARVAARRRARRDRRASTSRPAAPPSSPPSPGRDLDRAELAALARPADVLAAMDCGLFRSADGRFGFRHACCARPSTPTSTTPAARRTTRRSARALARQPGRGRAPPAARRPRRPRRRAGSSRPRRDAVRATALARGRRLPGGGGRAAPRRRRQLRSSSRTCSPSSARREPRALEARSSDRPRRRRRRARHRRAALWFRGPLCDPAGARTPPARGLDACRSTTVDARAELLLIRAWGEVTIEGVDGRARRTLAELEALGLDLEARPDARATT